MMMKRARTAHSSAGRSNGQASIMTGTGGNYVNIEGRLARMDIVKTTTTPRGQSI
jgi:hypothetical protein